MPGRSAFFSTRVTPGRASKLALPPCSSLELSNAAIEAGTGRADPSARCVLECDLATHSFVLCSLVPGGPRQAALGAVVTNDPAQRAWFFLKARVHPAARSHGHRIITYRLTNQRCFSCAGPRPALLPRARPAILRSARWQRRRGSGRCRRIRSRGHGVGSRRRGRRHVRCTRGPEPRAGDGGGGGGGGGGLT